MLETIAAVAQVALLALIFYNSIIALWGLKNRPAASAGSRSRAFRIVVPAHNEAAVLPGLLGDLVEQDYPGALYRTTVLADRCTDDTAAVASGHAQVAERSDGPDGKGPALAWYLDKHPLGENENLLILDADNRVPADLLGLLSDELDAGHVVLQCYLDSARTGRPVATASALTYWASNRMVQLARRNLGWSCDLGGTGMCFGAGALDPVGGFGDNLAEDRELAIRLVLAGVPVTWLHHVRIGDEKPGSVAVAAKQRARWASGRRLVARQYFTRLVTAGLRRRSMELIDQAIRLVQPGRTFVALVSGIFTVLAALDVPLLFGWPIWLAATVVQVALPVVFLVRDRTPFKLVVQYPLIVIVAALWLPVQILSRRRSSDWYHTPHEGS